MSSENFDKKIKESLADRNPDYNEQSWNKMEQILDKHLPVEKDNRRRFFFMLFLFFLLGGGSYLIFNNFSGNPSPKTSNRVTPASKLMAVEGENSLTKPITNNVIPKSEDFNVAVIDEKLKKKTANVFLKNKDEALTESSNISENKTETKIQDLIDKDKTENIQLKKLESGENIKPEKNKASEKESNKTSNESITELPTEKINNENKPVEKIEPKKKLEKDSKRGFLSNFAFSLSAGPDMSKVGSNKNGSIRLNYGIGLGYRVSKRIGIKTGFYAVHKIYKATASDYNPPTNFWNYYPNLKEINADCLVYDLPVNLDFYFSQKNRQHFFVSAGLSTLIMKKEEYNYLFKPAYSPQYVSYKRVHENENKHYFSTFNFSAGYSRIINNKISIQAEPYVKIALSGVGYGKVNLNSAGVLFSINIKPFYKDNNQKNKP